MIRYPDLQYMIGEGFKSPMVVKEPKMRQKTKCYKIAKAI